MGSVVRRVREAWKLLWNRLVGRTRVDSDVQPDAPRVGASNQLGGWADPPRPRQPVGFGDVRGVHGDSGKLAFRSLGKDWIAKGSPDDERMLRKLRWQHFLRLLEERFAKGAEEYGDQSYRKCYGELIDELEQEVVDICGWAFFVFNRLHEMAEKLED